MKRFLLVLPIYLLLFSLSVKAQEALFSFRTIDVPLPDVSFQSAQAINDRNQIVGGFQLTSSTVLHGFLYENGQFTTIDVSPTGGALLGINKKGQISGFLTDSNGIHGFLFYRGVTSLVDAPGANLTEGTGLNDEGQIVGDYRDTSSGQFHGFLYDSGEVVLIDVPGASTTGPNDINNRDQIVGIYDDNTGRHGFLYDSGLFTTIDVPFQNAQVTIPRAINDRRDIVGLYSDRNANHGFLFRDGVFTSVDVPGASSTEIWGINNKGTIVGRYLDSSTLSHGFLGVPIKP